MHNSQSTAAERSVGGGAAAADAVHRHQGARFLRIGFDLLAELSDVLVEGARGAGAGGTPDLVQQVVPGEHFAGMAGVAFQEGPVRGRSGLRSDSTLHATSRAGRAAWAAGLKPAAPSSAAIIQMLHFAFMFVLQCRRFSGLAGRSEPY